MMVMAFLGFIAGVHARAESVTYIFTDTTGPFPVERASLTFASPPAEPNAFWQSMDRTSVLSASILNDPTYGNDTYQNPFPPPPVHGDIFEAFSSDGSHLDGTSVGSTVIQLSLLFAPGSFTTLDTFKTVFINGQTILQYMIDGNKGPSVEIGTFGSWTLGAPPSTVPEPSGLLLSTIAGGIVVGVVQTRRLLRPRPVCNEPYRPRMDKLSQGRP
jgi:hypothetical protein